MLTEEQEIKVLHENSNVESEIKSASQSKVFENISNGNQTLEKRSTTTVILENSIIDDEEDVDNSWNYT
jgi:hypothetical protein